MLSEKQKIICEYCHKNGEITKDKAVELIDDYYHNGRKHVGDVLGRMVKRNLLLRIKRGVYKLGTGLSQEKEQIRNPNQLTIL